MNREGLHRQSSIKYGERQPQRQPMPQPKREQESNRPRQRRPYSWKTDELSGSETDLRQTERIHSPRPIHHRNPDTIRYTRPEAQAVALASRQLRSIVPGQYRCPRCATDSHPVFSKKISTAGWIVFAALLITFFPLFWIGFLIKEEVGICPTCGFKVK